MKCALCHEEAEANCPGALGATRPNPTPTWIRARDAALANTPRDAVASPIGYSSCFFCTYADLCHACLLNWIRGASSSVFLHNSARKVCTFKGLEIPDSFMPQRTLDILEGQQISAKTPACQCNRCKGRR